VADDLVRLMVVANELEAEMVRSLLSTAGIQSMQRYTNFGAAALDGMSSGVGPREILVHEENLEAARELIESD
jgi:hypothetical protein